MLSDNRNKLSSYYFKAGKLYKIISTIIIVAIKTV
jgi:hypothetical protein